MTAAELESAVKSLLAASLDAAYFAALDAATQTAAIKMATADVLARLSGVTVAGIAATAAEGPVVHAIAEQAVYLVRTHEEQAEGKVVTGEGVAGLSTSYTLIGDAANVGFAPRALQYIKQAKRQRLTVCRFGRG